MSDVHHIRAAAVTSGLAVRSIRRNHMNGKEIAVDAAMALTTSVGRSYRSAATLRSAAP